MDEESLAHTKWNCKYMRADKKELVSGNRISAGGMGPDMRTGTVSAAA